MELTYKLVANFHITYDINTDKEKIPSEFQEKWAHALNDLVFISHQKAFKYLEAKRRYLMLTSLLKEVSQPWPSLYLFLAEAHYILSDYSGCLEYLYLLQQRLPEDEMLSQKIDAITQFLESKTIQDEIFHNQSDAEGITLYTFATPMEYPRIPPDRDSLQTLMTNWDIFLENEVDGFAQFQRYASVASNILEGVFSLEGESWSRLIRRGFYINSIDGISLTSKTEKKEVIISILKNTLRCLGLLGECLSNPMSFTPAFIQLIHRTLLENVNFEETPLGESDTLVSLIPIGKFRSIPCITEHNEGRVVTQFCHPLHIESEMERYCELARNLLENDEIDLFIKVAWLQWAFLRIHPFADGNGRVSRIISSIPLSKLNLPPVAINQNNKFHYFEAIHHADRESNLQPLANFLKDSIESIFQDILHLPSSSELGITSTTFST